MVKKIKYKCKIYGWKYTKWIDYIKWKKKFSLIK